MGYYLQALIGTAEALGEHASDFQHAHLVLLAQRMALIPLTDELYCEVSKASEVDHIEKLSVAVSQWAQRMSFIAPVAYIEAEFFGGIGGQRAVVWSRGSEVIAPIHSQDAINLALRFLGVQIGNAHDEFDAIGLGQHRETRDWIA